MCLCGKEVSEEKQKEIEAEWETRTKCTKIEAVKMAFSGFKRGIVPCDECDFGHSPYDVMKQPEKYQKEIDFLKSQSTVACHSKNKPLGKSKCCDENSVWSEMGGCWVCIKCDRQFSIVTTLDYLKSIDARLAKIEKHLAPQISGTPEIPAWNVLEMKPEYTIEYLFGECEKLFPCKAWCDLNKITSDRSCIYTITFKPNIEADEENKNKSANDLKDVKTITLEERLILELQYFKATGKHLDIINWTLCAGSRGTDGHVPSASWNDYQFQVGYYRPDYSDGSIRARSAV